MFVFYVGLIAYAISKEHLFDIDLAFHHTFTWAMSLGTAAGLFVLCSFGVSFLPLSGTGHFLFLTFLSAMSTALFPKYFQLYENLSNDYILHHKYDYLKQMPQRAVLWTKHLLIPDLQKAIVTDFQEVMKFREARIFFAGDWVIGTHPAARNFYIINPENIDDENGVKIPKSLEILKFLEEQEKILFLSDLEKELRVSGLPEDYRVNVEKIAAQMKELASEVVMPIFCYLGHLKYLVGIACLGRWEREGQSKEISEADRQLMTDLLVEAGSAFKHAMKNRRLEILDEKKSNIIRDTLAEVKKLDKEKAEIEETLEKTRSKATKFMDMAAEFATKIQRIKEEQEDLETILRHIQSGVLTIRNGLIKTANKQARHLLLEIGDRIIDETFENVFKNQFKNTDRIVADIKKVIETGVASHTYETEWIRSGFNVPMEIKIIPLKDLFEAGRVNGALLEITDVAEAREKQKLLHLKDKFDTFKGLLEGLRHELNNAMNILNTYSYAVGHLKEDVLNSPDFRKDFTEIIPKTVQFVSGLIESLAAANMPLQTEESVVLEPATVLAEVDGELKERFSTAGIKFHKEITPGLKLRARPEHLKAIFSETIKNSIESIEEFDRQRQLGQVPRVGGKIGVSIKPAPTGGIEIEISDNGVGIDEVNLDKVLNPFFTTKVHSVAHSETGTGLGLNKVYNVLQLYDGGLKISSKLGEGTTVVIDLKDGGK